ncbi:MAG TPA: hypothetical protein VJR23_08005 [Candidatus Acidoferrales bacterium]|nr:hypothetical protein [Candidatus Acidoferrales bacterium]
MMRRWVVAAFLFLLMAAAAFYASAMKPASARAAGVITSTSSFPRVMPGGALLYIQAKDVSGLLADWWASPEKKQWLASDNFEVFSQSRLLLRLQDAQKEFTAAAGIPPDEAFLAQAAGKESALAFYNIGNLEFLYISRVRSADAMQSALWQTRSKFEPRSAGGVNFFVHSDNDSRRTVAFAVTGEYLMLATREDLLAASLELMAGGSGARLADDPWYAKAVEAAGKQGDLRMVLDLSVISHEPHFRSYWIQSNVKEMQQYSSAISDLYRSGDGYREERVLIQNSGTSAVATAEVPISAATRNTAGDSGGTVAELVRIVPEKAAVYRAVAGPAPDEALTLLETKIIAPRISAAPAPNLTPNVSLSGGQVGSTGDLETRIDEPPAVHVRNDDRVATLRKLLEAAGIRAMLSVDSTRGDVASSFVSVHLAVVIASTTDWDADSMRAALARTIAQSTTAKSSGGAWRSGGRLPDDYFELEGLAPIQMAVRGKLFILSDDEDTMEAILRRLSDPGQARDSSAAAAAPLVYAAGFRHSLARPDYLRLTLALDQAVSGDSANAGMKYTGMAADSNLAPDGWREPAFFSANIGSLSGVLSPLDSESVFIRRAGDKTYQTVIYKWK